MDMNKAFFLRKEDRDPKWHVIDATGQVVGRLATEIANRLRGKDKASFTPHTDGGDYVVVLNCENVVFTGNKWSDKIYKRYSGWKSGLKERTALQVMEKDPTRILQEAVKGMLPKTTLGRQSMLKLKLYVGNEHPHFAQVNTK